ncbi:hypothetical protein DCAR_0519979 [Daucus carota subsp. sativus]|uniref:Uncharacterized protein n=1 Tax=Daucus carota subsp. sativus TaxID=79200 RepID=A0AAF0X2H7_DAUCS|nr:hypothetical protein DCAR_0519979 [Daucus carota subsp. sativus]
MHVPGRKYKKKTPSDDGDEESAAVQDGDVVQDGASAENNDTAESKKTQKGPVHGPNWLLGRSGKSRRTMNKPLHVGQSSTSNSTADVAEMKKTIRDELVAEMQEMIYKKVQEKLTKVMGRLGELVPDLREVAVEDFCANVDKGVDEEAQNDR